MATTKVISALSGQAVIFTAPTIQKGRISALNVDQQGGSTRVIQLTDTFTPDASAGTTSPTAQRKTLLQVTLDVGTVYSADVNSLKDIEVLGICEAVGDVLDSGCVITVNYNFKDEPTR